MGKGWTKTDWRAKPRVQMPDYPDQAALNGVEATLAKMPPLVFAGGVWKEVLEDRLERLHELQEALYAEDKQALLIVLQAMDTAGKEGTCLHASGR